MNNKFFSILGLCNRARMLVSGEQNAENAIRSEKAKLIVLAEDASENTVKKFMNSSKFYKIPLLKYGLKEDIGSALGKEERAVVAVIDPGFTKKLMELYQIEKSIQLSDQ